MTRIDHAGKARQILAEIPDGATEAGTMAWCAEAQVHATLAIVEQQRIANLIAVEAATEPRDHASYLLHNAQTDKDATFPIWELRPDIAAALGLTAGQEG